MVITANLICKRAVDSEKRPGHRIRAVATPPIFVNGNSATGAIGPMGNQREIRDYPCRSRPSVHKIKIPKSKFGQAAFCV
jgi:hypothetical protein